MDLVRSFNDGVAGKVFLLSTKAGGAGLNLIGANRLILFDPDWYESLCGASKSLRSTTADHATTGAHGAMRGASQEPSQRSTGNGASLARRPDEESIRLSTRHHRLRGREGARGFDQCDLLLADRSEWPLLKLPRLMPTAW